MKKLLSLVLAIAIIICAVPIGAFTFAVSAEEFEGTEGYYSYEVENEQATIIDVDSSISGNITIPSTLGGYPVTVINEQAFCDCYALESVVIPSSVTNIASQAFYNCASIKEIVVDSNNSIYSSYEGVLFNKTKTELLFYPSGKTETTYTIPDSVTKINGYAFCDSNNLLSINVNDDNMYFSSHNGVLFNKSKTELIFYPSQRDEASYIIPNTVKIIADYAFSLSQLSNIELPDTLTKIGNGAFYFCSNLTGITIPNSVTSIGDFAFYSCSNISEITIPNGVTRIGNYTFSSCDNLTNISIPNTVTSIGNYAFGYCKFSNINIPDSVKSIGHFAFFICENLSSISIPSGVTCISESMFYNCSSLESVNLPNSLTTIESCAFIDCSKLANINIPDGVNYIGSSAFASCSSLTNITIPYGVTYINNDAFYACESLNSVIIYNKECEIYSDEYSKNGLENADVIYGFVNSTAQEFAKENDIEFIDIMTIHSHIFKDATCEAPKTCKVCNGTEGSKLTHVSDNGTITKEATCKAAGTKIYKCKLCKKAIKTETIAKTAHSYDTGKIIKKATCKATGIKTYTCSVCKGTKNVAIAKLTTHTFKTTITKATLTKNGSIVKKCTVCNKVASNKTAIKYVKSFKLSTTSYAYNGKVKTPSVTVKDSAGKVLKKNTDYTVTYSSGRKNVGIYKVIVKMRGKYSGTKTLYFKINPAGTSVSKLNAGKKSISVAIAKKSAQVSGYQIQYTTSKKFTSAKTKTITSYKTTKTTLKSLSAKKTYYVRVRTYKTVNGTKYYSGWSTYKFVKTK